MAQGASDQLSRRGQYAVYATGLFGISTDHMMSLLVPLWVVTLNPSPVLLGVIIGARHYLSLILAIHGGMMMDKLGTRRVMFFFAAVSTAMPLIYPIAPWILTIIALQMIFGFTSSMGWIGAQTLIGQVMKGDPTHAGRLAFAVRVGALAGPPLMGATWDLFGQWGAFPLMSLWVSGLLVALSFLPPPAAADDGAPPAKVKLRDVMPNFRDYINAFALLASPIILFLVMMSVLRLSAVSLQNSFFIVAVANMGFTGTLIGALFAIAALSGIPATLTTGVVARHFSAYWLLLVTIIGAVVTLTLTPFLASFGALAVFAGVRGIFMALSQGMLISVTAQAAGPGAQGKTVGLRNTVNRIAQSTLPVITGAIIQAVGFEKGFLIVGGGLIAIGITFAVLLRRFARPPDPDAPAPKSGLGG